MAKSFKYKDNNFLDSTGVVHNRIPLNKIFGKILWTNSNSASEFSPQTINLSSDDYDCYEILYRVATTGNTYLNTGKIPKGSGTALIFISGGNSETPIRTRSVNYISDTSFEVRPLYTGSTNTTTINNNYCIPYMVIGYKTGLF